MKTYYAAKPIILKFHLNTTIYQKIQKLCMLRDKVRSYSQTKNVNTTLDFHVAESNIFTMILLYKVSLNFVHRIEIDFRHGKLFYSAPNSYREL